MSLPGITRNAVVAASAGTGKTELLTSIYLAHALGLHGQGEAVPTLRIVATTFSRAAAREIRERLELRLAGVAGSDDAEHARRLGPLLLELAQAQGLPREELARRARRALEELPDAAIDTLHNLCARILREHGLELGLSPSFTILEEQRALEDTEHTIDEVLTEALGDSGTRALGARQLLDASGGLDRLRGWLLALLARLDDEGLDATALERGAEGAAASSAAAQLARVCQELASDPKSPRAPLAFAVLSVLRESPLDAERLGRAFGALAAEKKGRTLAGGAALSALLERSRGQNNGDKARAIARLIVEGPGLDARLAGVAEVVEEIQRRVRSRHVAQGTLGFGDLLRLTRDGLRDHPEVARAAGARIELLLVDEFQDTSRVQCDLLLLLRERPEASARREPGRLARAPDIAARGLVVVGDRKQSIYGFRGADVSVFAELASELAGEAATRLLALPAELTATHEPVADVFTLVDSYRSDPAIVAAVNLIAEHDFVPRLGRSFEIKYAEAEALRLPPARRSDDPGRFRLLVEDSLTPAAEPLVARAVGAQRLALSVAGFCARALAEGKPARSLAILARRRATLPLVGFALDHFGIPYVVSGRDLYGTPEVRDVFAALRLSQSPRDRHALATIARSPLGGLSDQALVDLSDPKRGLLPIDEWRPEALSSPEDAAAALELRTRLAGFLKIAPRLSPRDAIFDAVQRFRLSGVLARLPRGAVRLANLGRLQEIAATHGGNLAAFVRWLTRQIALETDETEAAIFSDEDDAVRLLTIHGSKGLAFPTVILADADAVEGSPSAPVALLRRPRGVPLLVVRHTGEDGPIFTDTQAELAEDARARAQAERQRLSYVALTRAEHELVVALPKQPRAGTLAKTLFSLREAGELAKLPGFDELAVSALLEEPPQSASQALPGSDPPALPPLAPCADVVLGVTALADFCACPRRFSLLQLQGLEEPRGAHGVRGELRGEPPPPSADPRLSGIAAHRVLEQWPLSRWGDAPDAPALAELMAQAGLDPLSAAGAQTLAGLSRFLGGKYAGLVREQAVSVRRELELTVVLEAKAGGAPLAARGRPKRDPRQLELFGSAQRELAPSLAPSAGGPALIVKATLDLLVELRDGSLHVIDYKRTRGGAADAVRYAPQLALYRHAVRARLGREPRVGLLHLLGNAAEPEWLEPAELDALALARAFADARAHDRWAAVEVATCRAIRCGFISSCHPGSDA